MKVTNGCAIHPPTATAWDNSRHIVVKDNGDFLFIRHQSSEEEITITRRELKEKWYW